MKHATRKDSSRKVAFTFPLQVSKRKTRDGRALSSSDVRLHMTEHRPLHIPPGLPHDEFKGRRSSHTQKVKATSSKSKPLGRFPKQDVIGNLINYAWTPGARNLNNSAKERLKRRIAAKASHTPRKSETAAEEDEDALPVTLNLLFNMAPRVAMGIVERAKETPRMLGSHGHASNGPLSIRGGPYDGTAYGRFLRLMRSKDFRSLAQ